MAMHTAVLLADRREKEERRLVKLREEEERAEKRRQENEELSRARRERKHEHAKGRLRKKQTKPSSCESRNSTLRRSVDWRGVVGVNHLSILPVHVVYGLYYVLDIF